MDLIKPLKVIESISFDAPQLEPAVALRRANFDLALAATYLEIRMLREIEMHSGPDQPRIPM